MPCVLYNVLIRQSTFSLIIVFFDMKVEVVALSSYEEKEEKFKEEVALFF